MGIEDKIPTSLRKSQQVKADCSCWIKSMNLEAASPPPPPPLLCSQLALLFFYFLSAEKAKWEICHDFQGFHNLHQLPASAHLVFFLSLLCCFRWAWNSVEAGSCYATLRYASQGWFFNFKY